MRFGIFLLTRTSTTGSKATVYRVPVTPKPFNSFSIHREAHCRNSKVWVHSVKVPMRSGVDEGAGKVYGDVKLAAVN